jgi:pyrroloquinoline-quinone synthase
MLIQETSRPALTEPPRDAEEFVSALRHQSRRYWGAHPFHIRLHAGELTESDLRIWAANRWYYQKNLPMKDAAILSNCPLPEVRRAWIARIHYHDGHIEGEGGMASWLRLAEAVGLSREEVLDERHIVAGVRFAVDAYVTFARTRPWVEGIASGLTEIFAPGLMSRRVEAMREHYPWIAPGGLAYFESRIDVTPEEGEYTLGLVVKHSHTREQQDAAIAALGFKCDVLWSMLDAIEKACAAARPA